MVYCYSIAHSQHLQFTKVDYGDDEIHGCSPRVLPFLSLTRRRATKWNLENVKSTLGSRTRGFKVPSVEIALHKFARCECGELLARFIKLWHSKSRSTWLAVCLTWFSIHDNPNYTRHLCGFAGKNMSKAQLDSFLSINFRARKLCSLHFP